MAQGVQIGDTVVYELHSVAVAMRRSWNQLRGFAYRYELKGLVLGWRWFSLESTLKAWLNDFPCVTTIADPEFELEEFAPDPGTPLLVKAPIVYVNQDSYVQPLTLSNLLGVDYDVLRTWLNQSGCALNLAKTKDERYNLPVVKCETVCRLIDERFLRDYKRDRRPGDLDPNVVRRCSRCQGTGSVATRGLPLGVKCTRCGGTGNNPSDAKRLL